MPINPTYPGVYIQELPSAVRTITGVSTSITAFIGRAIKGPIDNPLLIHSFTDYERLYGGLSRYSGMSYAVYQYFQNGGKDAVIIRVHNGGPDTTSTFNIIGDAFKIKAASPGQWSNNLAITISWPNYNDIPELVTAEENTLPTTGDPATNNTLFNLEVKEQISDTEMNVLETFHNLSTKKDSRRFVGRVLEEESEFVRGEVAMPPTGQSPGRPSEDTYKLEAPMGTAGNDGNELADSDIIGALTLLDKADLFNLLCIPPYNKTSDETTSSGVYDNALQYIENNQKRAFLIIDSPNAWNIASSPITNQSTGVNSTDFRKLRNKNAAIFFPRIKAQDPLDENKIREFVPCGVVAGIIARTDSERGVWKSPAGIEATLRGVSDLAVNLTDLQNGDLNQLGINCLRIMGVAGMVVWGARTLRGADQLADQWKYLAVRRTALFIEESLYRGTQWVVFEPNDEPLWAQIRLNITAFMQDLFLKGAFQGSNPKEAYLVKCDDDTNTQKDIDRGIVNIVVGFAPLKPAEFVILQIKQLAGHTAGGGGGGA